MWQIKRALDPKNLEALDARLDDGRRVGGRGLRSRLVTARALRLALLVVGWRPAESTPP